jgi:hypothetical protein
LGRVVQECSGVLMVDTSSGSGYFGWSAEETWWPGGRTFEEAMEHGPKDVRVGGSGEGGTSVKVEM